ncbi:MULTISPECIES: hypothetical protein, partial [unclassified Okeania]|uniref:hypothetical protein n=1 Tax=unclassified Okeania TaxID=2634635 RepID=UPI00258097E6
LSSSSILRCSWILKRLGIMAIAPGNYFSPLQLYTNDATGHDIKLSSNMMPKLDKRFSKLDESKIYY